MIEEEQVLALVIKLQYFHVELMHEILEKKLAQDGLKARESSTMRVVDIYNSAFPDHVFLLNMSKNDR